MNLLNEELYFYYITLKTKFVSVDTYEHWLNKVFLVSDNSNEVLLDLQLCGRNLDETINILYIYLFDKLNLIDYHVVMKMLIHEIKKRNDNDTELYELTKKLYEIWNLLPEEVAYEQPFLILNSIDDPWSWGGKEAIIRNIENLLNYYN